MSTTSRLSTTATPLATNHACCWNGRDCAPLSAFEHCAAAICRAANREGIHLRAGVHVGEVELIGSDVRGVAVHEAARIMAKAAEDEILVSEITRTLALASGLVFHDRGHHTLKGFPGQWRLFAYLANAQSPPE